VGTPHWIDFAELASAPITATIQGAVVSADTTGDIHEYVTFGPPDFWRVEDSEHRLRYLANETGHYQFPVGGGPVACFQPRLLGRRYGGGVESTALIYPRNLAQPEDDDFTRPIGPVEETVYLDRRAWRVVLAPPPRKPWPIVQVVDVVTGVTLAMESTMGTPLIAFTAIVTGKTIADDAFTDPAATGCVGD
jgi:hypothetical protein